MKTSAALLVAIFLAVPPCPAQPPSPWKTTATEQFDQAYQSLLSADEARDRRAFDEATGLYREALGAYTGLQQEYPQWQPAVVRFRIAYCNDQLDAILKRTGKKPAPAVVENVTPAAEKPVPTEPAAVVPAAGDDPLARARALLREGKSAEARVVLMERLRKDPDDRAVRLLMGVVQCQAQKFEDAAYLLEELVREDGVDAKARTTLATAYFALGRTDEALASLKEAIRVDPELAEAHYDLAQLLLTMKSPDLAAAREHYDRAVLLGAAPDKTIEGLLKPPSQ
jgi:tetratricopeptide (TPR) repeat protein